MPPVASLPTRAEFRALLSLAVPVVAVQLGLMLMGVVDTVMVGRLSAQALAAVALGNLYFFGVIVIGMGTLMALDPIVAQAVGARDDPAIARGLQRGILLATAITLPASAGMAAIRPLLRLSGQPPAIVDPASQYGWLIIPGILPFYLFLVLRQTLQAMGRIAPIVWVTLGANLLNALLDWILIFGKLGSPPLGVAGSALATTASRWVLAALLLAAGWRELGPRLRPWRRESWRLEPLLRMLGLGVPIGLQMFFEYGVFGLIGALMGRIGALALAAHHVALNLAAIVFMVPQGVGAAAAVLVGQAIGAGDIPRARRAALGAILLGAGFMAGSGTLFISLPEWLARLYTPDDSVVALAGTLIVLAASFAIFDGLQAVAIGILRGIGDTRVPVGLSLLGYWLIGLPVSLVLGFRLGFGPAGLWGGLVVGLLATAAVLLIRVRSRLRGMVERVRIDRPEVTAP
jgi:MATE family multidrug resistance protein